VTPGIPESFNVLVKELQGLGLNMELLIEEEAGSELEDFSALEGVEDDSFLDSDDFGLDDEEVPTRAGGLAGLDDEESLEDSDV
jgi:hypothetical protein